MPGDVTLRGETLEGGGLPPLWSAGACSRFGVGGGEGVRDAREKGFGLRSRARCHAHTQRRFAPLVRRDAGRHIRAVCVRATRPDPFLRRVLRRRSRRDRGRDRCRTIAASRYTAW